MSIVKGTACGVCDNCLGVDGSMKVKIGLGVIGPGLIGGEFIRQISSQVGAWFGLLVVVVQGIEAQVGVEEGVIGKRRFTRV